MAWTGRQERRGYRLERRVAAIARARRLFAPGHRVLTAVSGGPDSVALVRVLAALAPAWRLTVGVIHIHHGLRGLEADEDAEFVAGLCRRLGLLCRLERIELRGPGSGRSLQDSAREARYRVLRCAAADLGAERVALGHTADDQAETLLMWMLRGSGTSGLAGIPDTREGLFVRPLLGVSRAEILAYLDACGQSFREDSSNANPCYLRNRIRQELLPGLTRVNPALLRVFERQARILREDDQCLEQQTAEHLARLVRADGPEAVYLDREGLLALPLALQRRVVRGLLRRVSDRTQGPAFGSVSAVLDRVVHGRSGAGLQVNGALVTREYGELRFERGVSEGRQGPEPVTRSTEPALDSLSRGLPLAVPSSAQWPPTSQVIRVRLGDPGSKSDAAALAGARGAAVLDGDRFTWRLIARPWRPGDVFHPQGMGGHRKKVQDYFMDIKLPRLERSRVPILEAPEGILWIGGYRADHRFGAGPSTRRCVIVELADDPAEGRE